MSGALGAGQGEAAAGGHKLVHLLQRETLSILHGDSHSLGYSLHVTI